MEEGFRQRGLRVLLFTSTVPIIVITVVRIFHCWGNGAYLDHVSGVWIALANDLLHGVFYRPLFGPLGYGGTRYFPLFFVLETGFMKLGASSVMTGHLLSLAATLALMAGVYRLLQKLGVDNLLAFCSSVFILCSESTQLALLSIRGDVLPAALVVWGLAACCGPSIGLRQLIVAAALFTLAFSAKVTAFYGLGAALLSFLLSARHRQAWTLAVLSYTGFAIVLAGMLVASHGRAFEILRACLTGQGSLSSILHIPQRLALNTGGEDVGGFPFLVLATAAFLAWPVRFWKEIAPLFFLSATVITLIIMGSPGTIYNHLIDLHCAALVLLAVWISRSNQHHASFGLAAIAIAALLSIFPAGRNLHYGDDTLPRRQEFHAALQIAREHPGPILAENPLIPVLAGQTPYVLDPFMLRVLNQRDPHFAAPLVKKLQQKEFSLVVLEDDPGSKTGLSRYEKLHFGTGFSQGILDNYILFESVKGEYIFLPRKN